MAASAMCNNDSSAVGSLPATNALDQEQRKLMVVKEFRRASLDSKLSLDLFSLTFDDEVNSFPAITWDDSDEESDSDSVRSLDCWNSILTKSDSTGSLGKRGRNESASRRLVRSKKIKSNLSTLALGLSF
eukprot:CAMPEP_0176188926 /NCGR_PEP_ID=MMETSP0121_2-20121125/3168_1 /TAXON_ID=160619 /ORGANISM="Kryptoperidinium foliaceum, Strain CCMP 1326" /LENGTH=129 /DNA_ID=CAMNT_0017527519 /DNA_START=7 /DNA_END=396 /DNA_ORIENTATION=-